MTENNLESKVPRLVEQFKNSSLILNNRFKNFAKNTTLKDISQTETTNCFNFKLLLIDLRSIFNLETSDLKF